VKLKDLVGETKYQDWKNKISQVAQRVPTAWTIDKLGKIKKFSVKLSPDIMIGYEILGEPVFAIGTGSGKPEADTVTTKPLETDKILNRLSRSIDLKVDTPNIIDKEDNIVLVFATFPENIRVRNLEKTNSISVRAIVPDGVYAVVIETNNIHAVTGVVSTPDEFAEYFNGAETAIIGRPRTSKKADREFKNINAYAIYKLT